MLRDLPYPLVAFLVTFVWGGVIKGSFTLYTRSTVTGRVAGAASRWLQLSVLLVGYSVAGLPSVVRALGHPESGLQHVQYILISAILCFGIWEWCIPFMISALRSKPTQAKAYDPPNKFAVLQWFCSLLFVLSPGLLLSKEGLPQPTGTQGVVALGITTYATFCILCHPRFHGMRVGSTPFSIVDTPIGEELRQIGAAFNLSFKDITVVPGHMGSADRVTPAQAQRLLMGCRYRLSSLQFPTDIFRVMQPEALTAHVAFELSAKFPRPVYAPKLGVTALVICYVMGLGVIIPKIVSQFLISKTVSPILGALSICLAPALYSVPFIWFMHARGWIRPSHSICVDAFRAWSAAAPNDSPRDFVGFATALIAADGVTYTRHMIRAMFDTRTYRRAAFECEGLSPDELIAGIEERFRARGHEVTGA
jgi:hypothetical protein